jgi:hypothetical protein
LGHVKLELQKGAHDISNDASKVGFWLESGQNTLRDRKRSSVRDREKKTVGSIRKKMKWDASIEL